MPSSHISHQTGAELFTFPAQMIGLIELVMQRPNNQIVAAIVGMLHDRTCRGNGMSTRITERKPSTGNSGYNIGACIKGKEGIGESDTETQLIKDFAQCRVAASSLDGNE
jgi:hypothetical protein